MDGAAILAWLAAHPQLVGGAAFLSVVGLVATLLLAPAWAIHLPADFFSPECERRQRLQRSRPRGYLALVLRNVGGAILVLVGIALLVLPGPGMIAILVGVMAMEFPGRLRLARWLVSRPPALRSINWMRIRAGRPPLVPPVAA